MKVAVAGHNIVLESVDEWAIAKDWSDPAIQKLHGIYLRSAQYGVQIHVRAFGACGHDLTEPGLLDLLREQQWASRPFDEKTTFVDHLIVVAGTFAIQGEDRVVREFFIADGHSVANAAMPGTCVEVAAALASAERLVATIRFEPTGR